MSVSRIIHGLATFVVPASPHRPAETISARYCYTVFMRHLVKLHAATGCIPLGRIAELGPPLVPATEPTKKGLAETNLGFKSGTPAGGASEE